MILWIFSKKQNPNGSENAGHAIYWFKGLSANERESGITGFSGLHLLYHWERAPKMVQEVGLLLPHLPLRLPPLLTGTSHWGPLSSSRPSWAG